MLHLQLIIVCATFKVKLTVDFVTSMFSFTLNTVSIILQHNKYENRQNDFDAFGLQRNKEWTVFLYINNLQDMKTLNMILDLVLYLYACIIFCLYKLLTLKCEHINNKDYHT